jgi:hypothetical protein
MTKFKAFRAYQESQKMKTQAKTRVPSVALTVTADGGFIALVDDACYQGTIDRDALSMRDDGTKGMKWKRGYKPKEESARLAITQAAVWLVGLTPRV